MRRKHNRHNRAVALVVAVALTGACIVAGCSAVKSENIKSFTSKDTAQKIEKIKDKAGRAADKAGRAADKAEGLFDRIKGAVDRLVEKAGGKEEITKRVKNILGRFASDRSRINSAEDIELKSLDNQGYAYRFTYAGEKFRAVYSSYWDTWTIYDSYKIINDHDMRIICQALIDVHPVHGSDLKSYRTADDMAYEWQQHNIVYELLPDNNRWKSSAKNVDLDPYDQGKSYKEIYEDRTGKEFNIKNFV
ncbi:MAG: hypothetical protein IKF07_08765 [Eubacterium sp.]|nr:hypothetical protein [Eubacterium sp.]